MNTHTFQITDCYHGRGHAGRVPPLDMAAVYATEESLGRAIAEDLKRQLIKSHDEVFVTSELGCTDANPMSHSPCLEEESRVRIVEYFYLAADNRRKSFPSLSALKL